MNTTGIRIKLPHSKPEPCSAWQVQSVYTYIWLEHQRHLVSSFPVIDQERLSQNGHIRANLLNRNSEFKFECSYEREHERFQPTDYKLFINILCEIREGSVLYERESISNARMRSTEECQHVAPYTWNSTRCFIRWLPTFWSISVAIDQQFWSRHRIHILKLPSIFPP